jgi:hypothetical protein
VIVVRRQKAFIAVLAIVARFAFGQGGPPMITDDPGTPGNGKWENNLAISFEHRPGEWLLDAPAIDLNYGWGDHIQLTLQTSLAVLKDNERGAVAGVGGTEAAVKWRFLDEERSGLDVSIFPRTLFNVAQSSVRRGLSESGTGFQIPFEIAKKIGGFDLDFEFGPLISTVARTEWLYGMVAGKELTNRTKVMAELHGTSRTNFTRDRLTVNIGWRHQMSEHAIWIASVGHEIHTPNDESLALIGYCGLQLVY